MASPATPATASSTTHHDPTLGFVSLEREVEIDELALSGELPAWLDGSLLRTGPAKFEIGERRLRHWFDGLAMLHRFTVHNGAVSYGNRFLESRTYRDSRARGQMLYSEFATDPCRSLFKRVQSAFSPALADNANVNIAKLGERFIAMTETSLPVQFDPATLRSAGVTLHPYQAPGQLSTAHPHADRASGELLNYAAKLGARSSYRFFAVAPNDSATSRKIATLPVKEPGYVHSFGLTERWLVLAEFPLVVNPLALALSGRPYIENYRWKPELGTRFTLVDRSSGETVAGFQTDACFSFHHVNAFDDGDHVVLDLCAYEDSSIVEDLYLENLRNGKPAAQAQLTRFRLSLREKTVERRQLSDTQLELPRINYRRCNERPYRHVWGVSGGPGEWVQQIVKIDVEDGSTLVYSEPNCYPGEPVFVSRPGAEVEDDGVLLSVVLDAAAASSFLLVLDARDLRELARAQAPHHIPFGFHGQFARG